MEHRVYDNNADITCKCTVSQGITNITDDLNTVLLQIHSSICVPIITSIQEDIIKLLQYFCATVYKIHTGVMDLGVTTTT